ncbi:MAG TPA: hypothetical protein DHW80_09190, partial [Acinetobacter sp.]|nr:hypothetical protein [Acinetobacter sp.]
DGIRGALAIIVALSHAFGHYTGWGSGIYPIQYASFAVDIFFILSGIVLYHAHQQEISSGIMSFSAFFKKRFLRLYPMHLFGILMVPLAFMISIGQPYPDWVGNVSPINLLGDVLMMNAINVGFDLSSNQPSWSISVEFYIGTLIAFACCKNKLMALALAIATVIVYYLVTMNNPALDQRSIFLFNSGIVRCLYCMSVGICGYTIVMSMRDFLNSSPVFSGFVGVGGFLVMCYIVVNGHMPMHIYFAVVAMLAVSISMIGCLGFNSLSLLDSKFFVMLGKRSFSIYLMHTPVLYLFISLKGQNNFINSFIAISAIILTVVVSGYTYRFIEQPFIKRKKNSES